MTQHFLKNNFSRGEFSPKALSRVDLEMYVGGVESLNNFVSVPHGGIRRRSGTKFIGYPKRNTGSLFFMDFVYSTTGDAYVIEVSDTSMRFWRQDGFLVGVSKAITGMTNANPCVVTCPGHGFSNGDQITISNISLDYPGPVEANNRRFTIGSVTTNTFTLTGVNSTSWGTYGVSSGGLATKAYDIGAPYADADVEDLQYVQTGNAIYITHPDYRPQKLTRISNLNWAIQPVDFVDGPWLPINGTEATLAQSTNADVTVGTEITIALSDASAVNDGSGFLSSDVGRQLRIKMTKAAGGGDPSSNANPPTFAYWCSGTITSYIDNTHIKWMPQRILNPVRDTNVAGRFYGGAGGQASKSWRLGAFSDTTGYPKCIEVFDGRMVYANTPNDQRTVFFSRSGLPRDFAPSDADATVTASHSITAEILAGKVDQVLWLKDGPKLQIGTSSGIRTIGGTDNQGALSPTNISQRLEVDYGSSTDCLPVSVGTARIYASRFGKHLHRLYYDYNVNGLVAPPFSRLHDHLLKDGVKKLEYQQTPDPIVWVLTNTGDIVAIPFDADEKIIAFDPMDFGATCIQMSCVPGTDRDYMMFCFERTLNGVTTRTMEVLDADFSPLDGALEDGYFVDCGATYSGTARNKITGLYWLAGKSVAVLADGSFKQGLSVDATGALTLPGGMTASKVHVGLPFESHFKTLRPPAQQDDGFILGRRQRAVRALVEVLRTGDLYIGVSDTNKDIIKNRMTSTPFGVPANLKQGTYMCQLDDSWRGGQVYGVVTAPHPCFVRSLLISHDAEHV